MLSLSHSLSISVFRSWINIRTTLCACGVEHPRNPTPLDNATQPRRPQSPAPAPRFSRWRQRVPAYLCIPRVLITLPSAPHTSLPQKISSTNRYCLAQDVSTTPAHRIDMHTIRAHTKNMLLYAQRQNAVFCRRRHPMSCCRRNGWRFWWSW